jgi:(S)-ureidoglycine aminohydrolase
MSPPMRQLSPARAATKKGFLSLCLFALCCDSGLLAQTPVKSDVYAWKDAPVEKTRTGFKREIVSGMATDFQFMDISATTLKKNKMENEGVQTNFEEMVIVKDGLLEVTINGKFQTVGRGSVAVIVPGDERSFVNATNSETTYYVFRYRSKNPPDWERGKESGGSFVMDWNDVKFVPRDDGKGGTRSFFTRSTVMGRRLELHSTLLEPGQSSHTPHHHRAEELVVILHANAEMYLGPEETGGRTKKATDGDIIYLVSNEYHALGNPGNEPALYIAFQFQ